MKYVDLFRLEDCLSSNLANSLHVKVEKEMSYEKAFNVTGPFKDMEAKGLYIVVFCEDEAEANYLWNIIMNEKKELKWSNPMLKTVNKDGDYKLIIEVNE